MEAAGEHDLFWEMTDKMITGQNEWSAFPDAASVFAGYVEQLGLDRSDFVCDIRSNKYNDIISADMSDGMALGVNSTPTFFVNGRRYPGVMSYEDFKSLIEAELAGVNQEG